MLYDARVIHTLRTMMWAGAVGAGLTLSLAAPAVAAKPVTPGAFCKRADVGKVRQGDDGAWYKCMYGAGDETPHWYGTDKPGVNPPGKPPTNTCPTTRPGPPSNPTTTPPRVTTAPTTATVTPSSPASTPDDDVPSAGVKLIRYRLTPKPTCTTTTTATPKPTVTATTSPAAPGGSDDEDELPVTGPGGAALAVGGTLLVGAGVTAIVVNRRRRPRFTA